MAIFGAFYDANVLYPFRLRNFLMHLALTGIFRAHWSAEVHDEWIRNLPNNRPDITLDKLDRTRQLMDKALPDALVTGDEYLIEWGLDNAFSQVLKWARSRGMVKLGRVAIDSMRDDADPGGLDVASGELNKALKALPRRMERLKKSGLKKLSRADEDARFLRQRGGLVPVYTAIT